MQIDNVIVSSDNSEYLDYWDLVSEVWKNKIGIEPILAFVGSREQAKNISKKNGIIEVFEPIGGVSTAQTSQIVRFFCASKFLNKVVLISDIDMLPLNKNYFTKQIEHAEENKIVIFSSDAYAQNIRFPMCYLAAKGSTFQEINGNGFYYEEIPKWLGFGFGWFTDEKVFYKNWNDWNRIDRTVFLERGFRKEASSVGKKFDLIARIDRTTKSCYNEGLLNSGYYIDYHMPRPFDEYKDIILNISEKIK